MTSQKPVILDSREQMVRVYHYSVPAGQTLDTLQEPDYWSHVTRFMKPGYRIEALSEDGSWWANLIVRSVGRVEAVVSVLQYEALEEARDMAAGKEFNIRWGNPKTGFRIFRISSGEVVNEGFQTREAAEIWVKNRGAIDAAGAA